MPTVPSYRIGLVVPSSNVTMETEIPALLRAYESVTGLSFTFHGARMRMKQVTAEALLAMDREGSTCASYLADAECDVLAYACLVAVMVQGARAHESVAERLRAATKEAGYEAPVVTSAGALVDEIKASGYSRVSLVARMPAVREWVNEMVRRAAEGSPVVVDGRDMGTAVFPQARVKVFLVADSWERAKRRLIQRLERQPTEDEVAEEVDALVHRDAKDEAQTRQAADAVLIDTTYLTQEEQVDRIVALARRALRQG